MKKIVKGDELMVFMNDKSVAFATAHTLTLTANTTDIASKDHGVYGAKDVSTISWEATTENLYATDDYETLYDAMMTCKPVKVTFGPAAQWTNSGIDNSSKTWAPEAKGVKTGQALITSLVANANTGENATFSATFTGVGALTKIATQSLENGSQVVVQSAKK